MFYRLFESFIFGPYLLVIVTGLFLYWFIKTKQTGWVLRFCLAVLLAHVFFANVFVNALFSLPLRFLIPENSSESADAIVVHGSGAHPIGAPTLASSVRGYLGTLVVLNGRAPLLLLMGYSAADTLGSAKSMRIIAKGMGVSDDQIIMVGGQSTYEEAQIGGELLRKYGVKSVILVTSWYHVPRVQAVWNAQGFETVTHTYVPKLNLSRDFFSWYHLLHFRQISHEYAGIFVYWLRGWL